MDFARELDGTVVLTASPSPFSSTPQRHLPLPSFGAAFQPRETPSSNAGPVINPEDRPAGESSDEDFPVNKLSEQVSQLKLHPNYPSYPRFSGKSSGIRLVYDAFMTKHETEPSSIMLERARTLMLRRPQFWTISPVRRIRCICSKQELILGKI